jgi:hypothetical protein
MGVTELQNPGAENVNSYIETTVYLPSPAIGGEDIVLLSMFVVQKEKYTLSAYTGTFEHHFR